jgi:UPF0716 protein FxsA
LVVALLVGVAFFVVPFVEMLVIFAVGPRIGWDTTVTLLVLFSAAGAWLVKREGLGALRRIQNGLQAGRMPTSHMVDGFLVLLSGALLLCPGFVTSALGILLILPPVRSRANRLAGDAIRTRVSRRIRTVGARLNDDPVGSGPGTFAGPASNGARPNGARANTAGPHGAGTNGARPNGARPNGARPNPAGATGQGYAGGSAGAASANQRRAYRRPDEAEPDLTGDGVWGARVRRGPVDDLDVIDLDGEEIVFGQGELGPSGF